MISAKWLTPIVASLALFFFLFALPTPVALGMSKPFVPCVNPARIKVGNEVFYIRRPSRVSVRWLDPGEVRELCRASEAVSATTWGAGVELGAILPETDSEAGIYGVTKGKYTHQISVSYIDLSTQSNFQSLYKNTEILLKIMKVRKDSLPLTNGFYVWRKNGRPTLSASDFKKLSDLGQYLYSNSLYIAANTNLSSPQGEPAVIACQDYGRTEEHCRAMIWDGEVAFQISGLSSVTTSKERWEDYYKGFIALRKFLLSAPSSHAPH